jgi:inner membrane protein
MASAFAHALMAAAIGKTYSHRFFSRKFWLLGIFCTILPDADVIMFRFGVAYAHVLGHRGFSHSLLFALLLALLVTLTFFRSAIYPAADKVKLVLFFFLCTVSHAILDAMTTGGLGVAFFAPFNNSRYFFPWRPIQVSPIGVHNFFSEWGLRVIRSEFIWIGAPCILFVLIAWIFKPKSVSPAVKPSQD